MSETTEVYGTTSDDLIQLIDQAITVLQTNKETMTDSLLLVIQSAIGQARNMKDVIASALAIPAEDVDRIFIAVDRAMEVEQRLVNTDMTDKLIGILDKIKSRPIILRMIAALL